MANRSKKVILSARIDPSLKAGIELAAASQKEKIVAFLEYCIQGGLSTLVIADPFGKERGKQTAFSLFHSSVWSEDEVVYKLRVGYLGPDYAPLDLVDAAAVVNSEKCFSGDYDLYGDLNGNVKKLDLIAPNVRVNIDKIKREWKLILEYVEFKKKNIHLNVDYEKYLELAYERNIPL